PPTFIDEQAAPAAGRHKTRQQTLFERGADVPAAADIESADRACAQPLRDLERRQHTNRARKLWPPCAERQQQKLEVDWFAGAVLRRDTRNRAGAFVRKDREKVGDGGLACRRPEAEERFPLELAAEQRTNPRAGEANRMTGTAIERKDEGVAQRAANSAGLDVGALGRWACPALFQPIGIKLAARGVFHE